MLRDYMAMGGPLMWPLLVFSILLGGVLIERLWVVGVRHRLMGHALPRRILYWHQSALPFFADIPPAVGLLGTVVGVVRSFNLVDGQLQGQDVGAGLSIACMTTIFGLGIAIVASISQHALNWAIGDAPGVVQPAGASVANSGGTAGGGATGGTASGGGGGGQP